MADIEKEANQTPFSRPSTQHDKAAEVDEALLFLESHGENASTDEAKLKAIRRKIDWHISPILASCFFVQQLDNFALNYAAVMGLPKDLQLQGNDFTNIAAAFFIAFILVEIPNVYFLQRFPAAKWLGLNIFLWGIATACTAAVTNFSSLLACRILLGIFEATTFPSSHTITEQWYTKAEAAPRYAYWMVGNAAAQTLGGLFSFGFQHMDGGALSGWRTMFIVFGTLTVVVGTAVFLFIPDTPMQAKFLSDEEKASLLKHVAANKTGIRNHKFKAGEIWEAARDPQIWLFAVATICLASSSGIITTYSATLIRNMGYTPKEAALLNMPSGIVSLVAVLGAGYGIRLTPGHHRWFWISLCSLVAALGGGLMSFLPASKKGGLLVGIWLINAITATMTLMYHYSSVNVAGHTKRSFTANMLAVCFGLGNIVGPQSFQARDAPDYVPAKITALFTEAATALLMGVLVVYYVWENRRRNRKHAESGPDEQSEEVWAGWTNGKNQKWRYVY